MKRRQNIPFGEGYFFRAGGIRYLYSGFFPYAALLLSGIVTLQTLFCSSAIAQVANPYVINGDASQINCNCYILTQDDFNLHGSVWNKNLINLDSSFTYYFNVFLGCNPPGLGADGIAFVLQPISTEIGATGGGLGYQGISPSVDIQIDTYQNFDDNDPSYDHIAIEKDGNVVHGDTDELAAPVQALPDSPDIKDCIWHVFEIQWDAVNHILNAYIDGSLRVTATYDLVNQIFGGNPTVYWGFTASTGGSRDLQQFCTSLNARYALDSGLKRCLGSLVDFRDSSTSFGSIIKWYWNFGDGNTDTVADPVPHYYPNPGFYNVQLAIEGNNLCESDTFDQQVVIGTYPTAAFNVAAPDCTQRPLQLTDQSTNQVGQINQWYWSIDSQQVDTQQNPILNFDSTGTHLVRLAVSTAELCNSDTVQAYFTINATPAISMSAHDTCIYDLIPFMATNLADSVAIQSWYWNFGDGDADSSENPAHAFQKGGAYLASVFALGMDGCYSDTLTDSIHIQALHAFAGDDTILARGQPLPLNGTGGTYYSWTPAEWITNPGISDPIATPTQDITYLLTVSSPQGCEDTASIAVKVYTGPEFYVPTAFTPNGDGRNDVFRPIPVGISHINFFRVYDRWGKMVYSTDQYMQGWDGKINGRNAGIGGYVWEVQGVDYLGKTLDQKGVVTLLR